MRSTNIIAYRKNGFFGIPVIGDKTSFAIKFDTGAANTIISLEKIVGDLSDIQLQQIKQGIQDRSVNPHEFTSA